MSFLLSLALMNACQTYSARCECYPAVPYEGYQIYVTEKCDGREESYKYQEHFYGTLEECREGIAQDSNCQTLK